MGASSVSVGPIHQLLAPLLRRGYQYSISVLNAAHYGVPQNRWVSLALSAYPCPALRVLPKLLIEPCPVCMPLPLSVYAEHLAVLGA